MHNRPQDETWSVIKTVKWSTDFLQRHGSDTPRLDVELLLSSVLSCKRIDLYVDYDRPLSKPEKRLFEECCKGVDGESLSLTFSGKKSLWD